MLGGIRTPNSVRHDRYTEHPLGEGFGIDILGPVRDGIPTGWLKTRAQTADPAPESGVVPTAGAGYVELCVD